MKRFGVRLLQNLFLVLLIVATSGFLYMEYVKSLEDADRYEELTNFFRGTEIASMVLQDHRLIAGGKDGILVLNLKTLKEEKLEGCPELSYIRAIYKDSENRIWIGHDDGVTVYENSDFHTYGIEEGLPDGRVYAIGENPSGKLFIGTWSGVLEIDLSGLSSNKNTGKADMETGISASIGALIENGRLITSEEGLTADLVNVIYCGERNDVWMGAYLSKTGGISILNEGEVVQTLYKKDGLRHSHITSIIKDSNGKIWVGAGFMDEGGASIFSGTEKGWSLEGDLSKADGLAGEKVRSLFQDSNGILWIGSEYDGVTLFTYEKDIEDGKVLDILTREKGLINNEVKTMVEDQDGNIWLGTKTGITRVDRSLMEVMK